MFDNISIECPRCNQDTNNPVIMGTYHVCGKCNAILIPIFESDNIVIDVIDSSDTFESTNHTKLNIDWEKIPFEFLNDKGWSNPPLMIERLVKGEYIQKIHIKSEGIGGWLALFAVGLVLNLIIFVIIIVTNVNSDEALIWTALLVILLFLMFTKNRAFPILAIIFIVTNLLAGIGTYEKNGLNSDIIRSLITAAIWIPYLIISERVKNTFVKSFFKKKKPILS